MGTEKQFVVLVLGAVVVVGAGVLVDNPVALIAMSVAWLAYVGKMALKDDAE